MKITDFFRNPSVVSEPVSFDKKVTSFPKSTVQSDAFSSLLQKKESSVPLKEKPRFERPEKEVQPKRNEPVKQEDSFKREDTLAEKKTEEAKETSLTEETNSVEEKEKIVREQSPVTETETSEEPTAETTTVLPENERSEEVLIEEEPVLVENSEAQEDSENDNWQDIPENDFTVESQDDSVLTNAELVTKENQAKEESLRAESQQLAEKEQGIRNGEARIVKEEKLSADRKENQAEKTAQRASDKEQATLEKQKDNAALEKTLISTDKEATAQQLRNLEKEQKNADTESANVNTTEEVTMLDNAHQTTLSEQSNNTSIHSTDTEKADLSFSEYEPIFEKVISQPSLRQSMNANLHEVQERKELRKLVQLERSLDLLPISRHDTSMGVTRDAREDSLLLISSFIKKASNGIGDALKQVNPFMSTSTPSKEAPVMIDKTPVVENSFFPEKSISPNADDGWGGFFKERTSFSETRDVLQARSVNLPFANTERGTLDSRVSTKVEGEKMSSVSVAPSGKEQSSTNNGSDFNQSSNQFFSQNPSSNAIAQTALVNELKRTLAPEIIKQIERIRKSEQSWMRLSFDAAGSESVHLHLRLLGDHVTVRFSNQTNSFKTAVQELWSGLQESAQELGVALDQPQFTETQK